MESAKPSNSRPSNYPPSPSLIPDFESEDGRYRVRFARDDEDLESILRLRYRVFNLELGEGLQGSHESGMDRDPFDAQCHHLMVHRRDDQQVIGTYRMQSSAMAADGIGFYSAQEFDFSSWPDGILDRAVETGRACIEAEHRHRSVLLLLWRGLGHYALHNRGRYIFGCCSLSSQEPSEGGRALEYLRRNGHLREDLPLPTRADYRCDYDRAALGDWQSVQLPRLFRTYLRYGAKICGEPALDRNFGTIDFLALVDLTRLDPATILRQFEIDLRSAR